MDPFTAWLAKRGVNWWLHNRPFSKEKRERRKALRKIRKENRRRKKQGLPPLEEPKHMFNKLRTSSVGVLAGMLTLGLMKILGLIFPDLVSAVPALEETVAAIVAYIAARLNKTPEDAGLV